MYRLPLTIIGLLVLVVGLGACRPTALINVLTPRGGFDVKKRTCPTVTTSASNWIFTRPQRSP